MNSMQDGATRQVYLGLSSLELMLWKVLIVVSTVAFLWGCLLLFKKWRRGSGKTRVDLSFKKIISRIFAILSHSWIGRNNISVGIAHAAIFYGFIALFIGTSILFVQVDVAGPLLGINFWKGYFYLIYSLALDIAGFLAICGVGYMAVRRGLVRPSRLNYARVDKKPVSKIRARYPLGDWLFLAELVFLLISGFLLEGLRISATNAQIERDWSPIGWWVSSLIDQLGATAETSASLHHGLWWVHGVVALTFVAQIPFTKAMHMLVSPVAVVIKLDEAPRVLTSVAEEDDGSEPASSGYTTLSDFAAKHLLDLDACTKCGKCHDVCPARAGGGPLSPRDLILDLREMAASGVESQPLIGSETLWACTTCQACTNICPVGVEHVPMIVEMRRSLVDKGELDPGAQAAMEQIEKTGNSFGQPRRSRAKWTKDVGFSVKDIRKEPAEFLWFVGDYASFDTRNQSVTKQVAHILRHCGVDFGLLFEDESTAGNDVRRVGEEYLWMSLSEKNIQAIEKCSFKRIITTDPHSYNTLKNEFPEAGAPWTPDQVIHHTELFVELIDAGKLSVVEPQERRMTYHDPCYLGRYNNVFDAPRTVLEYIGVELIEMPRNRENSFCCGAGGGRIWMKDPVNPDVERPSVNRISEATRLGVENFVVACPKDVVMYEDAIKTSGSSITLIEISELLTKAMGLKPAQQSEQEEEVV